MMKKLILCLSMALLSASAAYAQDAGITVEANYENYTLTLTGFAGTEYSGENVNLEIIQPIGKDVDEIPSITAENFKEKVSLFSHTTVKEDGSFTYLFQLDGMAKKEDPFWARAYVDSPDAGHEALKLVTSFSYTSKAEIDKKLEELKNGVKADTLQIDMELLGITLPGIWEQFDQAQKTYAEQLINEKIKVAATLTTESVKQDVRDGIFMTAAKAANSAVQLKTFLTAQEQADYFGLALTNSYYEALQNQQTVFNRMYQNQSKITVKDDTARLFLESLFLETAENLDHKSKVEKVLKDFSDILSEENRKSLEQLSAERLNRVYAAVVSAKQTDFDTMEQFSAMLSAAIKNSADSTSGGGGGTSGSGGSGGKKTGSSGQQVVTYPTKTDETIKASKSFDDIGSVSWAKEAIESLYDQKIVSGIEDGKFCPDQEITREEIVTMLCKAFGISASEKRGQFEDADESWSAGFVNAAYEQEIVRGMSERYFGAKEHVTREDMAVMAARAGKISGGDPAEFSDFAEISSYAQDAVSALSQKGVISGYADGSFRPKNKITRAEAAVMIYRLIHLK